jgi:alkylation response protein AidB-like acyl-CoA dehydrogenase
MSAHIEAARLLRDRAALACDEGRNTALESSQAKLFCVEAANRVVGECIQISGRYGCLREGPLEMYYRDARALGIAGGSLEVMKNNIARELIGD